MGNFRREILASGKSSSPGTAKEKASVEADALALASALDKGVELSSGALEHYARYFEPKVQAAGGTAERNLPPRPEVEVPLRKEAPTAEELQAIAGEQAKNDNLLDFLNIIPGKNGQYWTVYPFSFIIRGVELKGFIRILNRDPVGNLGPYAVLSEDGGQVIADIAGPKRQWRCFLRKTAGKIRADLRVYPEYPPETLKLLAKEAECFLGKNSGLLGDFCGFEEILVRNSEEFSSWAEELYAENLPILIDKEV
jgi:hypothetical protein